MFDPLFFILFRIIFILEKSILLEHRSILEYKHLAYTESRKFQTKLYLKEARGSRLVLFQVLYIKISLKDYMKQLFLWHCYFLFSFLFPSFFYLYYTEFSDRGFKPH